MADIVIDGTIGANRLLILDSTGKIPAVDGSQITAIAAGNIATGTIPIARIDTGTTANKIVKLDGNAKLPALDGSLITNVSGATKSASDPTVSTNPSGGVGSEWHNTTSGEVYICTDATAGVNVWTNIGAGSGDVQPYSFGGTQYGYATAGIANPSTPAVAQNIIDKWAFASDANATDVGDLTSVKGYCGGISSPTHGYSFGGNVNIIDKWSFSSGGNATDVGDTSTTKDGPVGTYTTGWGYSLGNYPVSPSGNKIEKIDFASDGNSVDQGDLTVARSYGAGGSSETHGYLAGGQSTSGGSMNVIDKHAFANSNNATDVGDLPSTNDRNTGSSSTTYGYSHGGVPVVTAVEKWSFASDSNAVATSNTLTLARYSPAGSSSTSHGYAAGGRNNGSNVNTIDKYAFATDVAGVDVGDLTQTRRGPGGHEY